MPGPAFRLLRSEASLASVCALALACVQWWPALERWQASGFGDWQMVHHNWEAARIALARFGEWPLWDPFHCGGVTVLGNPESQLYSPLFWLAFVIGSVPGAKVYLVLHVATALLGMYLLARQEYRQDRAPAALAAVAWGLSGCFAWDGAGGHATFLPFAFAPLVVLTFRRRLPVATAALLALTVVEGGTYPFPYFLLLLAFELGRTLPEPHARAAALRDCALLAVLVASIAAIRFVPIALALGDSPRTVDSHDALAPAEIVHMLTARAHGWRFPPHEFVWPEYGSYVGWPVLVLGAAGAACMLLRGAPRHLLVGLVSFGLLMLGSRAPYYPWPLLHELPIYDSLRVPSRFAILFTFYLALLAGHALQLLQQALLRVRLLPAPALLAIAVLAQAADMIRVNETVVDRWHGPALPRVDQPGPFHLVRERGRYIESYASYPLHNVGTDICYAGGMNWRVSRDLWLGEQAQVRVLHGAGRVRAWRMSTARIWAEVEVDRPARVVFNQNHAAGWTARGGELVADRGRLAVDVEPGRHAIELAYSPAALLPSAALSALGLLLAAALAWRARRAAQRARAIRPPDPVLHPEVSRTRAEERQGDTHG